MHVKLDVQERYVYTDPYSYNIEMTRFTVNLDSSAPIQENSSPWTVPDHTRKL